MTDRVAERVYVLRLRGNRYYVGSTLRCVKARWSEHCTGAGSRWTKRYAPERLVCWMEVPDGYGDQVENEVTRYLMWVHGWGRVRGGKWVFVKCRAAWWLPQELRSLGPADVLPLHARPVGHFCPQSRRLVEALEVGGGLHDPDHLDPDPFPR